MTPEKPVVEPLSAHHAHPWPCYEADCGIDAPRLDAARTASVAGLDGASMIAAERRRQIKSERYDADHDAGHADELALAAAAYAIPPDQRVRAPRLWPWAARYWKPKDRVRDLVRAGALIAAAIDAEQGSAPSIEQEPGDWTDLANDIRRADGNHDLGAGELAGRLWERGWRREQEPGEPDWRGVVREAIRRYRLPNLDDQGVANLVIGALEGHGFVARKQEPGERLRAAVGAFLEARSSRAGRRPRSRPTGDGAMSGRQWAFRLHRWMLDPWSVWHRITRHHWPYWYRTGYDFLTWRYECSICKPAENPQ